MFHAGTTTIDGKILTAGGRVLAVTASAPTLSDAVKKVYDGVSTISFDGMVYRRDIANRYARSDNSDERITSAEALQGLKPV